jgi:hypothetical protein
MPDNEALKNFLDGAPPKSIRLLAAGGLAPLPPVDMLLLLVRLSSDPDHEVAQKARQTLSGWSDDEIITQLQSPQCSPEVLEYFSGSASSAVQEAIILNPESAGAVVAKLASRASAPLLEIVLYNRMRLLDSPEILQSIKLNPAATPQILGQVREIETEFFGSKKRAYDALIAQTDAPAQEETIQFEPAPEDFSLEGLPVDPQEREAAILQRIGTMTIRQKIQLALMGNREARAVLIRDSNKEISASVMHSPKLTVNEVEGFAAMRQVSEDVLRQIGNSKAWTRSYAVVRNLAKNPKTPPMISQRMLLRLHPKDLTLISRDRGVPEAVRRTAVQVLKQRSANK